MTSRLPRLYLNAGQMKAGTTYLYAIMKTHREVHFSRQKELNFLPHRYGGTPGLSDAVRLRTAGRMIAEIEQADHPQPGRKHLLQRVGDYLSRRSGRNGEPGDGARLRRARAVVQDMLAGDHPPRERLRLQWVANYLRPIDTPGWYHNIFLGIRDGQWAGDFSNLTCTTPREGLIAMQELADDIRVSYCFRDPVERAFSHAKYHLKFAGEDSDLSRLSESELRDFLKSPNVYPQSQTETHVENLVAAFGEDRIRLIGCEDMWREPDRTAANLCAFLDIAPFQRALPVEPVNAGPEGQMTPDMQRIFDEVFAPCRDANRRVVERYRHLVIS